MALQKQAKGKRSGLKCQKLADTDECVKLVDTDEDIDSEKKTLAYRRKRCRTRGDGDHEDEDEREDMEGDMVDIFQSFRDDIQKTLNSKKQKLEAFTHEAYEANVRTMKKVTDGQATERKRLNGQFSHHVAQVLEQWEQDLKKTIESEDNLCAIIKQQQKLIQQNRATNTHRLKTLRQLHESYTKGVEDLEECHANHQASAKEELRKELADLEKKILEDTQRQDMANVRRSLSTVLLSGM